jgi:dTDP-4-dehydrorhamnose 3,5-epimerase
MPFTQTPIQDLIIFEPKVFEDERGYFFESYNQKLFEENGIEAKFIQDNQSKSSFGVLRGIHFQKPPFAQAKLVRVLSGKVLDVAVDLRPESATFGKYFGIELSAENKKQLFIPRGFGHGFVVLSDTAEFAYKCDNLYSKEHESGIIYNDADLKIDWQIETSELIISDKDQQLKSFVEFKNSLFSN